MSRVVYTSNSNSNFCVEQWPGICFKTMFFRGSNDFARCTPYKNHKKSRFWQLLRLPMRKHRNSCSGTLLHTPASANGHGAQKQRELEPKSCGTDIFAPKSHCFGNFCVEQWPGMGSKTVFFRGSSDFARCTPYKNHKKSRF